MTDLIGRLSDQTFRRQMGRRFEALADEAFSILRWTILVGFAEYLSVAFPHVGFRLLYWSLAGLLFGYLASRFLLRPEIRVFSAADTRPKRLMQSFLNFFICIVLFAAVLWIVAMLVSAVGDHQASA